MKENTATVDVSYLAEIRKANDARAGFCRFLASLFLYELTEEQIEAFAHIDCAGDGSDIGAALLDAKEYLRHRHGGTRQQLAVDYARVFLGAGNYDKILAPPYESVFTSEERILMQDARDGAVSYYRRAGMDLPADNTTPEDHLGFELQFFAVLIDRGSAAIDDNDMAAFGETLALQRGFFTQHLENWVPDFCAAVEEHAQTGFYKAVAAMTRAFIRDERLFFSEVSEHFDIAEEEADGGLDGEGGGERSDEGDNA